MDGGGDASNLNLNSVLNQSTGDEVKITKGIKEEEMGDGGTDGPTCQLKSEKAAGEILTSAKTELARLYTTKAVVYSEFVNVLTVLTSGLLKRELVGLKLKLLKLKNEIFCQEHSIDDDEPSSLTRSLLVAERQMCPPTLPDCAHHYDNNKFCSVVEVDQVPLTALGEEGKEILSIKDLSIEDNNYCGSSSLSSVEPPMCTMADFNSKNNQDAEIVNRFPLAQNILLDSIVQIKQLREQPDVRLCGKILVCRNSTIPVISAFKNNGQVITVLEDSFGEVVFLETSGMDLLESEVNDLLMLIPQTAMIVIHDPLFTITDDKRYSVVVRDIKEILFIPNPVFKRLVPEMNFMSPVLGSSGETEIEEAVNWKYVGSKFFIGKNYIHALNCFNISIKLNPGDMKTFSNRSATFLKMGIYGAALSDAEKVLEEEPTNIKAINRKSKALWGMGRCDDALKSLEGLIANFTNYWDMQNSGSIADRKFIEELIKKTEGLLLQQETGEYDLMKFYRFPGTRFEDQADYVGPLTVVQNAEIGNGVFATADIKAGQLIMAVKPYTCVLPGENTAANWILKINHLISYAIHRSQFDQTATRDFYLLNAGPDHNVLSSSEAKIQECDLARITNICELNAFGVDYKRSDGCEPMEFWDAALGIWILPSHLRHSCLDANCTWRVCGNFLFVRALKDIPNGQEILTSFSDITHPFHVRKLILDRHGFTCKCNLCKLDTNESMEIHVLREQLIEELGSILGEDKLLTTPTVITKLIELTDALKILRPNHHKMNYHLLSPLQTIGMAYFVQKRYKKSAEYFKKAFAIAEGTPLNGTLIYITMNLVVISIKAGQLAKAKKWAKGLKKYLMIGYGCIDVAELINKSAVDLMEENGIRLE